MVKSIVGKVVLGLMFVMSSTILVSQDSKVKYPNISGIWSVGGNSFIHNIFQKGDSVFVSCIDNGYTWFHYGKFIDKKTVILNQIGRYPNGCIFKSKNVFTLVNEKQIINEYEFVDNNCGHSKGKKGKNILYLIHIVEP